MNGPLHETFEIDLEYQPGEKLPKRNIPLSTDMGRIDTPEKLRDVINENIIAQYTTPQVAPRIPRDTELAKGTTFVGVIPQTSRMPTAEEIAAETREANKKRQEFLTDEEKIEMQKYIKYPDMGTDVPAQPVDVKKYWYGRDEELEERTLPLKLVEEYDRKVGAAKREIWRSYLTVERYRVEIHWLYTKLNQDIDMLKKGIEELEPQMVFTNREFSFLEQREAKVKFKDMKERIKAQETFSQASAKKIEGVTERIIKIMNDTIPVYEESLKTLSHAQERIVIDKKNAALAIRNDLEVARNLLIKQRRIMNIDMHNFLAYKKLFKDSLVVDKFYDQNAERLTKAVSEELKRICDEKKITNLEFTQLSDLLDLYFYYDYNYGKFFVYISEGKRRAIKDIYMNQRLAFKMGFEYEEVSPGWVKLVGRIRRGGFYAKYAPDIKEGVHQIYVYMPEIIADSYVGDTLVPLLRVINADKNKNTYAENIYVQEYHHRIVVKRITAIRIQLMSATGEYLSFDWGDVIVTLHFRKALFT